MFRSISVLPPRHLICKTVPFPQKVSCVLSKSIFFISTHFRKSLIWILSLYINFAFSILSYNWNPCLVLKIILHLALCLWNIHVVAFISSSFLLLQIDIHCTDLPEYINFCSISIFPITGYDKQDCYEYLCRSFCMNIYFNSFWVDVGIPWRYWRYGSRTVQLRNMTIKQVTWIFWFSSAL